MTTGAYPRSKARRRARTTTAKEALIKREDFMIQSIANNSATVAGRVILLSSIAVRSNCTAGVMKHANTTGKIKNNS